MPNIATQMTNRFFPPNIFSMKMHWILTDPTAYWTRNIIPGLIFQGFVCRDVTVNDVISATADTSVHVNSIVNVDKF